MNLHTAMQTSWNGMKNSEKGIFIASKNIANATNEDYQKIGINTVYNAINGVETTGITRIVDEALFGEFVQISSKVEYLSTKFEFLNTIQSYFGTPEPINSLNKNVFPTNLSSAINKMFNKLLTLSYNPANLSSNAAFVSQANIVVDMISDIKTALIDLQNNASQEVTHAVFVINEELQKLNRINFSIANEHSSDTDLMAKLKNNQDISLKKIAQYLEVKTVKKSDGKIYIYTQDGRSILSDSVTYLSYDSTQSQQLMLKNTLLDFRSISTGKIKALYEMRDYEIPKFLSEIDNLSITLKEEFNAIYSSGVNVLGTQELTSRVLFSNTDEFNFTGNVELVLLDKNGNQAFYGDGNKIKPLKLNLNNKTVSQVIDEINSHFNVKKHSVKINNQARDVALLARKMQDNNFIFDFKIDDISKKNSKLQIKDISVTYTDMIKNTLKYVVIEDAFLPYKLPVLEQTLIHNDINVTNIGISVDLSKMPIDAKNFQLEIDVLIDGKETVLKYDILKDSIRKDATYSPFDVYGQGSIFKNSIHGQLVEAQLLKKNGIDDFNKGYLDIKSDKYSLAFKNIDSFNGSSNFVHSLGFNDFFVTTDNNYLRINENIVENPYALNVSRFKENSYDIGLGNNDNVMKLLSLNNKAVNFRAAGNIAEHQNTIYGYCVNVIENIAQSSSHVESIMIHEQDFKKALEEKNASISGVNIDEEMANTKMFEYMYNASKKIVDLSDSLVHKLLDIV